MPDNTQHLSINRLVALAKEFVDHVFFQSARTLKANETSNKVDNNWALQKITLLEDGGIKEGHATTCDDGSFKHGQSTEGFTSFEEDNLQNQFEGANEVPVHLDDNVAYYGELRGIDGTISVRNVICTVFNVMSGKVTHGVDNQVALTNCF